MLEHEETLELIELAQNGDCLAKEKLVEHNSPLIKSILRRYKNKGIEYDDLFQLGSIGLLKAIKNFHSDYGVKFSTYAVPMIIGEIKRYLRDDGYVKVSRSTKSLAGKISFYCDEVRNKEGRSPTVEEISKALGVEPQEVVFAMDAVKIPLSLYDKGDDEQGQALYEKITNGDETDKTIDYMLIKDAISLLTEREKKIVILRYYKDKTQSQVARVLKVSQVQVSRLENKILNKIKEYICE